MKILLVNKFLYPNGGSETYIFELGRCLKRLGHEVQYFGMEHPDRIVGNDCELYTSNMSFRGASRFVSPLKLIYSREAADKIKLILDEFRPDVVHFNNINFQLTPSVIIAVNRWRQKNKKSVKIIYTAHDYQWICPNHMLKRIDNNNLCFACEGGKYTNCIRYKCIHGSRLRSILGTIEAQHYYRRRTYSLVDRIICPSSFIKDKLSTNYFLSDRCVVLTNFLPDNQVDDTTNIELQNNLDGNDYVLFFGRYSVEKGIKTLISACRKLPDIPFVFAGTGPLEDDVNCVQNVTNLGFLPSDKIHYYIKNARFVVYPSEWYENCPFSVMESIQLLTPVITTNLGGTVELVRDGYNGEIIEAGNAQILADRINRLWNDDELLHRYINGCVDTHFDSIDEYTQKLINIYSE